MLNVGKQARRWLVGKQWQIQYSAGCVGCWEKWISSVSSSGRAAHSPELIHNVGIVAHIDAGKTTTTERMLYYAGLTSRVGNVDSGNTVTDYLPPERDRGITISSATISLAWAGHTVNVIDTPGHADFTFEVERSLRVLDGAIALLDGSSGVEAQTLTVWRQAKHYHIPCIAFINKMDNPRASLHKAVQSMKTSLGVQPLLTQLPLGKGREFTGVVDLLQSCALFWSAGSESTSFSQVPLVELPQDIQEDAFQHQYQLLEQVAMLDDRLAAALLANDDIMTFDPKDLMAAIQRACLSGSGVPILCGSALRGVAIQPLMDAITAYLPPASEATHRIPLLAQGLCAYAFKQVYDAHRGLLVYLRIYTGTLQPHTTIYNASRNLREKPTRVLLAQADELEEVGGAYEGSIAVAVGLKHTQTGDTLVQSAAVARAIEKEGSILLAPPTVPPPVFFCTVEPSSAANQRSLDHALQCLSREDPSLRVTVDRDSGQTVLSGMGELHLEIVKERLQRVYRVPCELGLLQVAYREGIALEVGATTSTKAKTHYSVVATVTLTPVVGKDIDVAFDPKIDVRSEEEKVELKGTLKASMAQGPLLGFPLQGVSVSVVGLSRSEGTPLPLVCSCLAQAVHKALQGAEVRLLEPFTELEVTVPDHYVGAVLSDLTSLRRAQVKGVSANDSEGQSTVAALVPLASLLGYASRLRGLTSGTGTFSMTFSGHYPVDPCHQNTIVQELRGY